MKRAVFFDVDGVLIHGYHADPEFTRKWDANLLEDMGIEPDEFRSEFIFGPFIKDVLPGKRAIVDALDEVLPRLGFHGSSLVLLDYWLKNDSTINVAVFEIAKSLAHHDDVALYVATNQEHIRANWLWQSLGFGQVFNDMFYAARLGVMKPDPAFFDGIMAHIGPQSAPPLFFDDSPEVIKAASAYGWEAVQVETAHDIASHDWVRRRL